ncbi:MAG: rhodanese-like domain-containing protein [Acidobacteriaceae bacterium]
MAAGGSGTPLMSLRHRNARLFLPLLLVAVAVMPLRAQFSGVASPASASVIPKSALLQPEQLHNQLQAHATLLILQVGSKYLYQEAHIPGAEYAGPGSRPEGLAALRSRVQRLPRNQPIVIYCGCCPWDRCPNIGPAWQLLHSMKFTNVRVLYLSNNFGSDWVGLGYDAEPSN